MIAFALFLLESALYVRDDFRAFQHLIGISQPVIYIFGPAIYTLCSHHRRYGRSAGASRGLILLPAAAVLAYFLVF